MKSVVAALVSAVIVGLMLIPNGVCAQPTMTTVSDAEGDLGMYDVLFGAARASGRVIPVVPSWGNDAPMKKVSYLDMTSLSFGAIDDDSYVYDVVVAGDVPQVGDALPHGIKLVAWLLWIDSPPWTPENPAQSMYEVWVQYDGTGYAGICRNTATRELTFIPFTMGTSSIHIDVSKDMIGNPENFYWSAATFALTNYNTLGWMVDVNDLEKVEGQVWFDMPWPSV